MIRIPRPVTRAALCLAAAALALAPAVGWPPAARAEAPVLLVGIGVHIEPFGARVSALVSTNAPPGNNPDLDYARRPLFDRHARDLAETAAMLERHGGRLTVQAQTAFTTAAAAFGDPVLHDLERRGHEIALHFHEDAHLGPDPETLSADTWCAVMQQEIALIHAAGVEEPVRYWSGGNLFPGLLEAAACAGLSVNGDYKNPHTQQTDPLVVGLSPWRPAGGPVEGDMAAFAAHDPGGAIVFLPQGTEDADAFGRKREIRAAGGNAAWFDVLADTLLASLAAARPDHVNVFRFTIHPGEFSTAELESFVREHLDPLVAAGRVRWATYGEMADAFAAWEDAHPGVDPRATAF